MSDPKLQNGETAGPTAEGEVALADVFGKLVSLADQCSSGSGFYRGGFRIIAEWLNSPYAAISIRYAGTAVEDHWHTGPTDPAFWRPAVDSLLTGVLAAGRAQMRLFRARHGALRISLLSAPVLDRNGRLIGAIALCAPVGDDATAHRQLSNLTALSSLLSFLAAAVVKVREDQQARSCLSDLFEWGAIADAESARQLAYRVTNDLCNRLGCEQVALGVIRRERARILSVSGLDHVTKWSPGIRLIRSAMEECHDHGRPIVCQDEDWTSEELKLEHRLHRQWSQTAGGAAVASIPFRIGEQQAIVISLRARSGGSFKPEIIEDMAATLTPVVATMPLVQSATRTLTAHLLESAHGQVAALAAPKGRVRRILLVAAIALASWVGFGTMPFRVPVPCRVVPATLQHVVAPFDGTVRTALVAAGDEVTAGQLLYELETEPLRLERRRLLAELEVSRIEVDRALADDQPADAVLAAARLRVNEARLAVIDDRLGRAAAQASFDGTVLEGDLRKLTGQSVAQGDPLYVISPDREWIVELEIPESAIDEISLGQLGRLACDARPEQRQGCEIVRLLPRAQVRDGRNVFVAEASVAQPEDWVRPGMQGMVQIDAGRRPVWWLATHRFIDFLRRKLWI